MTTNQVKKLIQAYNIEKGINIDVTKMSNDELEAYYSNFIVNQSNETQRNEFFTWMFNLVRVVTHRSLINGEAQSYKVFLLSEYKHTTVKYVYNVLLPERESNTTFGVDDFNGDKVEAEVIEYSDTDKVKFTTEVSATILARGNLNELTRQLSILQTTLKTNVAYYINNKVQEQFTNGLLGDNPAVYTVELNFDKAPQVAINKLMTLAKTFIKEIGDWNNSYNSPIKKGGTSFTHITQGSDLVTVINNNFSAKLDTQYNRTNFNPQTLVTGGTTINKNLKDGIKMVILHKEKFQYGISIDSGGKVDLQATNLKELSATHLWMNSGQYDKSHPAISFRHNGSLKIFEMNIIDNGVKTNTTFEDIESLPQKVTVETSVLKEGQGK